MPYYIYTFSWPAGEDVQSVQVTGTFDNWQKSLPPLVKDDSSNSFKGSVKVSEKSDFEFKFIINEHNWAINPEYATKADEFGNENNFVPGDDLIMFEEFEQGDQGDQPEQPQKVIDDPDNGDGENIQQVLTSSSSFAAVSLPGDASNFEHVDPIPKPVPVDEDPDQLETIPKPNLSDSNSTLNTPRGVTSNDAPETSSKIPGAYPVTPSSESSTGSIHPSGNASASNSPRKPGTKKDGLVSRFKGFFR